MQYVPRDWKDKGESVMDYTNSSVDKAIDEYIHSERDKAILKRRLIDGICFEPLAAEFDMSVRQIKNIVYRGQEKVFVRLKLSTCGKP